MATHSPEILAVARRFLDAVVSQDSETLKNMLLDSDALSMVGSAEGEIWTGKSVRDGISQHFAEAPRIVKSEEISSQAYQSGDIGWCVTQRRFSFEGTEGSAVFRTTLIFTLHQGSWKLVHRHGSVGRPNADVHGSEHALLNELAELARVGFSLHQKEGMASVMFTDVVDSTMLASMLGDRAWTHTMGAHLSMIARVVEEHGGELVKSLGDGSMTSFPSASAALRAAIQIQEELAASQSEPRLSVRIGVHTGDVIQTDDDFFGTVVNKAARISGEATGGEILFSEETRAMIAGAAEFRSEPTGAVPLKGLAGVHMIHRLVLNGK